ncbi:hypothetical protein [Cupriavidus sp. IDO]|uniref:hypothetical protein n=1 Tax=Cupriavidus sp. IDO TaxID=1539142 RepID=UPI001269DC3B|nr:hypothetical protein [Cupriavidus sp. IDO]
MPFSRFVCAHYERKQWFIADLRDSLRVEGLTAESAQFVRHTSAKSPQLSLLDHPCVPLPPAPERAFHIAEFTPSFPSAVFSFRKNSFHIAKFVVYLIEK